MLSPTKDQRELSQSVECLDLRSMADRRDKPKACRNGLDVGGRRKGAPNDDLDPSHCHPDRWSNSCQRSTPLHSHAQAGSVRGRFKINGRVIGRALWLLLCFVGDRRGGEGRQLATLNAPQPQGARRVRRESWRAVAFDRSARTGCHLNWCISCNGCKEFIPAYSVFPPFNDRQWEANVGERRMR